MRLNVEPARAALAASAPGFGGVFRDDGTPFEPSDLQAAVERLNLGPIVVLEAVKGSGETGTALWRFRSLMAAGAVESLAFLLPTRTAAVRIER